MKKSSAENSLVFLLGAGFSVDAASEAGDPMALSSGRPAQYPLVSDLLDICFGMGALPPDKSIEDLFEDCIDEGNRQPLQVLYELLMETDYYITPCLKCGGSHENNAYLRFLRDFPRAPLLTFNYDSLPEILLLAEHWWRPEDGYGVPVQAKHRTLRDAKPLVDSSLRPVLHLHGSLCIYPATFYIERRPGPELDMLRFDRESEFLFDPDTLGHRFFPFERIPPSETYTYVADRVIAPVPNKAEGLKGEFIAAVYRQAIEFFRNAGQIVCIGYSFSHSDRASYAQLLAAVADRSILIVAPDAGSIVERLSHEHPLIQWEAKSMSFKDWVRDGYPGVKNDNLSCKHRIEQDSVNRADDAEVRQT